MDSPALESRRDSDSLNMIHQNQPVADRPLLQTNDSFLNGPSCTTMFKKGYLMNNKIFSACPKNTDALNLAAAVEHFVAQGGVIDIVSQSEHQPPTLSPPHAPSDDENAAFEKRAKLELLKALVAKGAGINALQYSLRMNRRDIKQLAAEHDVKIAFSRPLSDTGKAHRSEASDVDDTVAGHAMHYSSLGYSALEIANILDLSVRQVWNIGKAYRFEFKTPEGDPSR